MVDSVERALDVQEAVTNGFERALQRNGLMLVAAFFLLNVIGTATQVESTELLGPGLMLFLLVVSLLSLVFTVYLNVIAARVMVSDETADIPDRFTRKNVGSAVLHMIIGSLMLGIVVAMSVAPLFAALFVNGWLFAALLPVYIVLLAYAGLGVMFWNFYVAVEDETAWDAVAASWNLVTGVRVPVLVLTLVMLVISMLVMAPATALDMVLPQLVEGVVSDAAAGFVSVFSLAVLAQAYNQLRE